ncbi:hypothetical protein C8J56DRAFT_1047909 [Mycena floridula]|nr:hypothetical protein C8J56DRAFT_1047909 [Mycena floridula]
MASISLVDGFDMWRHGNDTEETEEVTSEPQVKAQGSRRKQNPGKRNALLIMIKRVVLISILGHSTSQRCNALQSIIGFFCESKNVPEVVLEMLAHMGISTSLGSIGNMHSSMIKEAKMRLEALPWSNYVYDNFDMDFKCAETTLENTGSHWSVTSATFVPLASDTSMAALRYNISMESGMLVVKQILQILESIVPPLGQKLDPLQLAFAWHIRAILVHQVLPMGQFKKLLGDGPEPIQPLKVEKTKQYPASAIDSDEMSYEGTWRVWMDLFQQRKPTDQELEQFLIFVHGDLATKDRMDGLRALRYIESTCKNRVEFYVFIMGLFHIKMACTDAFWRIYLIPKGGHKDETSVLEYLKRLRPKETGIFSSSNPGFRKMHDIIHHITWADVLDLCRVLQSRELLSFSSQRERPDSQRDMVFKNHALRKQHGLLYLEMCHATNYGDVGCILRLFPYWIAIFHATGKTKYSAHMITFMTDLQHVYPPLLRDGILRNWMCNPGETKDGFRGFDWLMERNNLYTKELNAEEGVNRTKELVIKRSILLEVYRSVHEIIENNFYLTHRTVRHTHPSMTSTLQKIGEYIQNSDPHTFHPARQPKTQSSGPTTMTQWMK